MAEVKRCICHLPMALNPAMQSASHIRPSKMFQAFQELGYEVTIIQGDGKTRQQAIASLKQSIKNGIKYDFVYSESSTMPTLLTESHHLPTYPRLDFDFFRFCKSHGIKIGLFYRDMHWAFPAYKAAVPVAKRLLSTAMYRYDLKKYRELVDILYVPTIRMIDLLKDHFPVSRIKTLPPGGDQPKVMDKPIKERLQFIYVGGVGGNYDLRNVMQAVADYPEVDLTFICRNYDWERVEDDYLPIMDRANNIRLLHVAGEAMESELQRADVAFGIIQKTPYLQLAMPFKTFEYLSYGLPIIGCHDTAVGDFILDHDCGWVTGDSVAEISQLIKALADQPQMVRTKSQISGTISQFNRWQDRAEQVAHDLK